VSTNFLSAASKPQPRQYNLDCACNQGNHASMHLDNPPQSGSSTSVLEIHLLLWNESTLLLEVAATAQAKKSAVLVPKSQC